MRDIKKVENRYFELYILSWYFTSFYRKKRVLLDSNTFKSLSSLFFRVNGIKL